MLQEEHISVRILKIGENGPPKTAQGLDLVIPFSGISVVSRQRAHVSKLK